MTSKIRWGIIGCGDVTELKSGPAFNKVPGSALVAVMRRDESKVKDYAQRHNVPKWYTDASQLINDPEVNAIYIATPPSSHEEYTIAALEAGKPVYVEKPMSLNAASALKMANTAKETSTSLCVAHYRRAQPLFRKIKQCLDEEVIGKVKLVHANLFKRSLTAEELLVPKIAWRLKPSISGGGLFHDLAPHQLDILYYFFGKIEQATGRSISEPGKSIPDTVTGNILFSNGVQFNGDWCFNTATGNEKDECVIIGEKGRIEFSFFDHRPIRIIKGEELEEIHFEPLQHVQQPMIEEVVNHFLGHAPNPCSGEDGVVVMELIDKFTSNDDTGYWMLDT